MSSLSPPPLCDPTEIQLTTGEARHIVWSWLNRPKVQIGSGWLVFSLMLLLFWRAESADIYNQQTNVAQNIAARLSVFSSEHIALALQHFNIVLDDLAAAATSEDPATRTAAIARANGARYIRSAAVYDLSTSVTPLLRGVKPPPPPPFPPTLTAQGLNFTASQLGAASGDPLLVSKQRLGESTIAVVSFDIAELAATLERVSLPEGWSLLVMGSEGQALLRLPKIQGAGPRPDTSAAIRRIAQLALAGGGVIIDHSPYDGLERIVGVAPAPISGLAIALSLPTAAMEAAAARDENRLTLVCCTIYLLGGLFFISLALSADRREREAAASKINGKVKSAFLAALSHELRTPLNAVIGFSDLLRSNIIPWTPESAQEHLVAIHNSGLHLQSVVDRTLDFVWVESAQRRLTLKPISWKEILTGLHPQWLAMAAARAQSFSSPPQEQERADSAWAVMGDHFAARRVAEALAAFASRVAGEGGRWGVDLICEPDAARLIAWGDHPIDGPAWWRPTSSRLADVDAVYTEPDPDSLALEAALSLAVAMGWRLETAADGKAVSALAPISPVAPLAA